MYLLLAVAAAVAASARSPTSQAYERNKEYLYEYETQALTGIPQGSTIYSGMKLKCDVRIQFRSRSSATLQMDKIALAKINDPIESVNPTQQQVPESLFRPLTGKDADQMIKDLSRPINFLYVRGSIHEIKQEADDPEWSVNVKKGLLSILEVNLDKRKQLDQSSSIPRVLRPQSANEDSMYKVMEPSIGGECETLYKVSPRTSSSGDPIMYITKVRNYKNCLDRPMYLTSMFHGKKCAECVKDRSDPLRSASQVMYTLRGNTRLFQIQSAIAESQHVFTPYSEKGGNVATYLNQTLNLINVMDVKDSLSQPSSPKTVRSGLQFSSREIESRDESLSSSQKSPPSSQSPASQVLSKQSQKSANQAKERIRKLLKMLETFMKPTIKEEAGPLLMSLLEEIRKADVESLRAVFRETVQSASADKKKLKMLMDLLPSAGTAPATEVLRDAIKNDQITKPQAAIALNILSLSARPEVLVAKTLLELTQSPKVSQNRMLKRASFLCLGAVAGKLREEEHRRSRQMARQERIVNTLMSTVSNSQSRKKLKSKKRDMGDRKRKQQSIYTRIRQEIVKEIQSLMKSTDIDDKILSFKTAGNSGLREMIPSIRTYIEDKSQPQLLRAQAIYSLRKLTSQHPQDIQSILLPRYFDRTEKEEVRISSYIVLTSTSPSRQLLEMVAHSLHREANPHVGTFVYTHLEQISNSTYPCLMSWAKNATFALRFAKKFSPTFQYSRFLQFSRYNDRVKLGAAAELGFITSPEEFIPRAGAVHLNTHVLGSSINFMEIGFNTEGLQTLLSKMVGPLGELTKGKSVVDVLKQRVRRSSQSKQTQSDPISQIHQQLKVSARTSPEPKGHLYIKMMGNELQYFSLDRSTMVEALLKEGKILLSVTEQKMKSGIDIDIHRSLIPLDADTMIPTESGLPLRLKLRGTAAVKVTGKMKVSGVPSLFQINRPGKAARELGLDLELNPSVLVDMRGEMEMDAEYFKAGVSIKSMAHVETPLSISTTFNLPTAKLITKVNIEKLNEKVAKMEISPSTYFKENPSDIAKYPAPRETQCIRAAEGAKAMPLSISFGKRSLGLEVGISGQAVVSDFEMNVPYYPMIGKQELFITLSPGINPQKYMEFQVQLMAPKQESAQQSASDKATNSGEEGIISKIASYLTLLSGGQSDQIPSSSSQPSSPPKDIKSKDSSLASLIQHLKEPQSVQSDKAVVSRNNSIGILINVIGIDESRSIKRHLQVCMAAGFDMSSRVTSILATLNRSPVPEVETKAWKMDIAIKLNLPTKLVNPSELMSESYQKELEKQIEVHIRRHGEDEYHRLIDREIPSQQIKVLKTLLSSTGTQEIIDEVVNTEVSQSEESSPSSDRKVIKLIREQKHLLKEVTNIRRKSSDPLKLQRIKSTLSSVIKWSEKVKQLLERESRSVPTSEESDNLRKYSALLQQIVEQRIEESVLSSSRALSSKDQQSLKKSLETNRESLRKILQKQSSSQRVSQSSQSNPQSPPIPEVQVEGSSQQQEPQQSEETQQRDSSKSQPGQSDSQSPSVPEVNSKEAQESPQKSEQSEQPEQQSRQSKKTSKQSEKSPQSREQLQRTHQQSQDSASLSQSKSKSPLSKSVSSLLQIQREAIQELSESKEKLDGAKNIDQKKIKEAVRVAKEVNEKIRREASTSLPHRIEKERAILLKAVIQQQQISKCLEQRIKRQKSKPQNQKEMQEMTTLLQHLKQENDKLSKVLAIATQQEKEREAVRGTRSQREQRTLESLRQVQLSQVIAVQQLVAAESSSSAKSRKDNAQPVQRVQQCMEILDETGTQIVSLIKQSNVNQSPPDVIAKLVEVIQMQHSLLGLVAGRAREQLIQSVSRSEAMDTRIEKLEEKAETEKLEYLQIMRNILKSIKAKRSVSSLSRSDNKMLQIVHNKMGLIRSMQIKIERRVRDIEKDQEKSAKKLESTTITELAAKCKTVQDEIEKVESDIRSNQLHQKVDDTTKEPLRRIEIQKQIVEKVKELIPKSEMSPQEKQTIQASLKTQEKRLEELQQKVQDLKNEESQHSSTSSSRESQSVQSSQNRPVAGIRQEDKLQDSKDRQNGDGTRNNRKSKEKSEQISRRSQKESAKQRSEKSINDQQTESRSSQPSDVDSKQSSDQSPSKRRPSSQQSDKSKDIRQKQKSSRKAKSSAPGDLKVETDREMCISVKAQYGAEGDKKKFFEVQILGTPSLEQLIWERAQKSPLERSSITKTYLREMRGGSEEVTSAYLKLSLEMNMIRHLHVRVHYEREEIPRSLEEFAWWTHEAMKAMMYRHLFTKYPHSFRPKDRLEVLLNFRRNNRQFDAEFKLSEESNFLRGISIPYFGPFLFESMKGIRDGLRRPLQKTLSSITSRLPGQCEVKHNQVRTMDGKEYSIPDTKDCKVVLSMDCSSAKQFAIKYRKDSSDPSKRAVEVHIEGKRIEIVPVKSSLDVKVDGKKEDIPAESAISVKVASSLSSNKDSRLEISRQQNRISISASRKGVHVTSDGHKISIKVTPFYYSQVCGLCGNFDGKQGNEYQSPQRVDRSDPNCFVLDYLIPDSKCDSGSVLKECHQHQNSSSPSRCLVKPETVLRTRLNKGVSQLCFSQSSVKSCPAHCKQKDPKSKAVPMVCYEHDSVKAKALKKASYKGPVSELKSHQADYTEYVQEPTSCGEA